ncbi:MAG: Chaperone protein DnaK [Candidatus Celerinatantimonas neptuna]|nr:MAG: Chaperone protein DnaK [Candidatus Celerinatantimonas neptuna]
MGYSSFAGFDFGTSNCALGAFNDSDLDIIQLPDHGRYMPSTMFAPKREMMSGWLFQQLKREGIEQSYFKARELKLSFALRALKEAELDGYDCELLFGKDAFEAYLEDPLDCYYVKSPKSFLGATGLTERHQQQFEDIVAAMIWHVRSQTAQTMGCWPKQVVIGRPVNFQGLNSQQSNQQAVQILTKAARFAGFEKIEFLYEPLAAGLTYQSTLTEPRRVLVVDIGGGTSDISFMEMGPAYNDSFDHEKLVLGYSGQRIGGNDFDIALNIQSLMPLLGMNQILATGQPMPHKVYFDAASVNNLPAQSDFYSQKGKQLLAHLKDDMQPQFWQRLVRLYEEQLTQRLNFSAEQSKIALGDESVYQCDLDYLDRSLTTEISVDSLQEASLKITDALNALITDVIAQGGVQPDVLFLTGGTAHSPIIRHYLAEKFAGIEQISGDNFGSVTGGLTRWARQIFTSEV